MVVTLFTTRNNDSEDEGMRDKLKKQAPPAQRQEEAESQSLNDLGYGIGHLNVERDFQFSGAYGSNSAWNTSHILSTNRWLINSTL